MTRLSERGLHRLRGSHPDGDIQAGLNPRSPRSLSRVPFPVWMLATPLLAHLIHGWIA